MKSTDGIVRIGMIGTGQIAQGHLNAYGKIPQAKVVACADIQEAAAKKTAETFGIPHVYTDFRELLRRDDIDAVDVCLHNNLHMPASVAAFAAGKHVYCEKPMAGSYRDAAAMLEASKQHNKKLHIQLSTLYANETRAAKELLEQGELGTVYHARSGGGRRRGRPFVDGYGTPTFVQKKNSAGGALYDVGVYRLAQMLYLLGNPKVERIGGTTYQKTDMDARRREISGYDVEELATGYVRFAGDLTLEIFEAWAMHLDSVEGCFLLGSKGGVRLNPFGFFRSYGDLDASATVSLDSAKFRWENVRGDFADRSSSQHHWVAALLGRTPLLPTAEIALGAMLISEGIYLSSQRRREVVREEVEAASVSTAAAI
jgi:predicted dehydrogenase